MEQGIITLTQVFTDLNTASHNTLFYFDGDKVIPSSNRVRLIFFDRFLTEEYKFSFSHLLEIPGEPRSFSYYTKEELGRTIEKNFEGFPRSFVFIYNPTQYHGGEFRHSTVRAMVEFSKEFRGDTKICIQQYDKETPPRASFFISTEELGELICMIYFREKGYIVQCPLHTYGKRGEESGVDDVIAWRSPIINNLRKFGFIGNGCHISELACLRWLDRTTSSFDASVGKEVNLIEVEPYEAKATGNSTNSGKHQLYRAVREKIAKRLFICFPFINEELDKIFQEIRNEPKAPTLGAILFDANGMHINDSGIFPDENVVSAVEEYERYLKRVLLNNFYFEEILEMIRELNLDSKNKGFQELLIEFCKTIEEIPVDYVLEKLDDLI